MPFRAEIIRGVRVAAILFTLVLCWIAGYRMFQPGPSQARPPASTTSSADPAENPAAHSVNQPLTTAAEPRGDAPAVQAQVPVPPPPQIHRIVRKREPPPSPVHIAAQPATATPAKSEPAAAPAEPKPLEELPVEAKTASPAVPVATSQVNAETPSGVPPPQEAASGKGPKRWVKAVSRFLHIGGKKDVTAEAVRQP